MSRLRYVIEWHFCIYDECYNSITDDYEMKRIIKDNKKYMEIFEDEIEFLERKRKLEDGWLEGYEIVGCYTCELQPIR